MADVVLHDELCSAVENNQFIKGGLLSSCEGIKYDFRLSKRILKADFKQPIDIGPSFDQTNLVVRPGEVVFVMTEETLELPNNIFCQLSAKRKLSHAGIITLGGFIVDPNYTGKLLFGLYNISSKEFPIMPGKKLVAGVFYKIDDDEVKKFSTTPESLNDFPDELVRLISDYKSLAIESLSEELNTIKLEMKSLKEQVDSDRSWKEDFKEGLEQHNQQITKLGETLQDIADKLGKEVDERKTTNSKISEQFHILRGIGYVLSFLFGGGLFTYLAWLTGILHK
jgi:dUTPase